MNQFNLSSNLVIHLLFKVTKQGFNPNCGTGACGTQRRGIVRALGHPSCAPRLRAQHVPAGIPRDAVWRSGEM